jgi:succinoglycan biosynthesis protein ExoM
MRKGDFHSIRPTWVNDEIVTGYTSNVLLDLKSPQIQERRFRVNLGTSGGEDTVFCSEYHRDGGKIAFAENAIVGEIVPAKRATLLWLITRRLRFGQTHAILLSESGNKSGFLLALPKAVMCFGAAIVTSFNRTKCVFWLLRGALHVGVLSKYIGMKTIHPYKKS